MRSPDLDDWQLLNEYAKENSDGAFRALVDRYAGMVYHAALRQIGDPYLAEEVTQAAFIALAQKAPGISKSVLIGGWLFRATRFAVLNLARAERLRRRREYEAVAMQATFPSTDHPDPVWEQISPFLDEALAELPAKDREAVIIRFFGNKSHKETGLSLGVTEDAAKKRLSRALSKLRRIFVKRGVVVPSLALATALSVSGAKAAPAGVASMTAAVALKHAAGGIISSPLIASSILTAMGHARLKVMVLSVFVTLLFAFQAANFFTHSTRTPALPLALAATPPEPPPGRIVVWDKHLPVPPTINVADATLEKALDGIASSSDAYWSVDYVVYESDASLRRLLDVFRTGASLESSGWTNLCAAPQTFGDVQVVNRNNPAAALPPGASDIVNQGAHVLSMTAVLDDDPPGGSGPSPEKQQAVADAVNRSVKEGASEGVLAPERLLADAQLLPRFRNSSGLTPTRETAARLASEAHAFWTIIYTLRKSPLPHVGIKLAHRAPTPPDDNPALVDPRFQVLSSWDSNRFDLSADEIAAHNQAAQNWLNQQAGNRAHSP